ncbi:hypothetical protein QJS04_geneDACA024099 [Acorus gramineus]|uniref:Uncharacterized protein n=1 Tax=Acorus gramineus TaxID=55184 RepID=A0AAV9AQK1_ACOGR|nr:hypothetical protein QJS04_geneDACA024099 [Acorus gramineus]
MLKMSDGQLKKKTTIGASSYGTAGNEGHHDEGVTHQAGSKDVHMEDSPRMTTEDPILRVELNVLDTLFKASFDILETEFIKLRREVTEGEIFHHRISLCLHLLPLFHFKVDDETQPMMADLILKTLQVQS